MINEYRSIRKYKCAYCSKKYMKAYSNWTFKHFNKYHPGKKRKLISIKNPK